MTAVTLSRLGPSDVDEMIGHIIGNNRLPPTIRQDIIERTDGVPLFVEEMTKAVLETASEDEARRTAAMVPSPALAVPATLHASLTARLDRLGPARELAQIGAAIGREFSRELLAAVAGRSEARLEGELNSLLRTGLLFQQGSPPDTTYLFKHALVQDAAYGLCCGRQDASFMLESLKPSRRSSARSPRTSPRSWRVTAPRRDISRKPRRCGGKPDSAPRNVRLWSRRKSSSNARST